MDEINNDKENVKQPTMDLLLRTLREAECEPDINEVGDACITYRDVPLHIQANEMQRTLTVFDTHWYSVSIYDAEAVISMKAEVNRVNSFGDAKLVYSESDDDCIYVHTLFTFAFTEEMVNLGAYLTEALDATLSYRQAFIKEESKQEITQ